MSGILNVYIMPHAPILIPEIGGIRGEEAAESVKGCKNVAEKILADLPETIIISSPHAPSYRDKAVISGGHSLMGDFSGFGHREIKLDIRNDTELSELIAAKARGNVIITDKGTLDHGALVPLYFINEAFKKAGRSFSLVHISTPFFASQELYELGSAISAAAEEAGRNSVYLASGDLSHMLTPGAPAGYSPAGKKYDERLVGFIQANDIRSMLSITEMEMYEAGECGTRSFIMGMGSLKGRSFTADIYSYEGPFGVGYLCAGLITEGQMNNQKTERDDYAGLARYTVERHVKEGIPVNPDDFFAGDPDNLKSRKAPASRAGVFVSIKKNGELRGCIGTIAPTCNSIYEEIVQNAISASSADPRFEPVRADELSLLSFSVDVLGEPEDISSAESLDVSRYGVIVSKGYRRGLLLPDLEGVDTPQQQIAIALRKAGISQYEKYAMQRFEVKRYQEDEN